MNARQVLLLVRKDLLRRLRSPLSTILVLVFPLVLASILAMAFGAGETEAPKVRLLLDDQDGSFVGSLVAQAFARPEAAQFFEVEKVEVEKAGADALEQLEEGQFSALLRLPPDLTEGLLDGRAVTLELNPQGVPPALPGWQ